MQQPKSNNKEDEHCQVEDHILRKFELLEFKGKGAYGVVWKAVDRKSKQIVALKKIFDAFHNATDSQRTFREVIFLEQLVNHDNIIRLLNVIKAENNKDLYMVFDYMETDVHKVIRANILEPIHKKYIVYQILKGLKYLHSGSLIHRDLKPSNLLINSECKVKVADFGLARTVNKPDDNSNPILTEYVATRWYRAPEILLGSQHYSKAVDMWSLGCILGEIIMGKALFPGTSTINQIERIIELIGRPKADDLEAIQAPLAEQVLSNIQTQKKKSFTQCFGQASEDAMDFIRKTLLYNPTKRMTVEQALNHPYLKEFKGTESEQSRESAIETFMDDNHKYSIKEYRDALYTHISQKKKLEHKTLVLKNVGSNNNISGDKSTSPTKSPTKKDSFVKKSRDSEPSDMSEHKIQDFQHPNRVMHHKSQSQNYSQYQVRKNTSVEIEQQQQQYVSPSVMKKTSQMFPIVDANSPIRRKASLIETRNKLNNSSLTNVQSALLNTLSKTNILSQQQQIQPFSRKTSIIANNTNTMHKTQSSKALTHYNSYFQKK